MHLRFFISIVFLVFLAVGGGRAEAAQTPLIRLVKKIQPAVATVIAYDLERNISNIGTGFFINPQGHLVTNFHVLAGRYAADVRTAAGRSYPVKAVVADNRAADLLRLQVEIPPAETAWIPLDEEVPEIGERVVVVGSPMGLEQTVSEGIVSSVREIPPVGTVFQMSAPISPGSSGSPVVNTRGRVVGIATFQFIQGQNLNFAVTARQIRALRKLDAALSVSEWTFSHLRNKPKAAEALCQSGFSFSVKGESRQALEYFRQATETDPSDADAWSGLGSCYAGLNHPEDAVAAYRQAVAAKRWPLIKRPSPSTRSSRRPISIWAWRFHARAATRRGAGRSKAWSASTPKPRRPITTPASLTASSGVSRMPSARRGPPSGWTRILRRPTMPWGRLSTGSGATQRGFRPTGRRSGWTRNSRRRITPSGPPC
ncbi:MAG: trypsin-like peptidase domain-containing protein [Desulfobacterales bacterium]|nr:trypsin-like peptidase domain-containing protein [Desulfobacterales bacterium]